MVKLKKYRKLKGIEKMRHDQKREHFISDLLYLDEVIIYAKLLNEDQIKYMYQKLDNYYIKYKNIIKKFQNFDNYFKNHSENISNETLKEINDLKHKLSMINYLLSDLKYLKKKLNSDLSSNEFYKSFKHDDYQNIMEYKNKFNEVFGEKMIDPLRFYNIISKAIKESDDVNKDKKRFKLLQRVKNV